MNTFVEFLTKLAPEGETSLFVKQKPRLVNGQQQYHNDGTPKYTWPPFLPEVATLADERGGFVALTGVGPRITRALRYPWWCVGGAANQAFSLAKWYTARHRDMVGFQDIKGTETSYRYSL